MTFDESFAHITNELCGRTIDHVVRNGKVLELYTTCGHIVKLQADDQYDIHYAGTGVNIQLDGIGIFGKANL